MPWKFITLNRILLCLPLLPGQPQRPGSKIRIYPGDVCHAFLWRERSRRSKDRLRNASQHQPFCVWNAFHALRKKARRCRRAVQEAHDPDKYVCSGWFPPPIPPLPVKPSNAFHVPGFSAVSGHSVLCRMIRNLFSLSVGKVRASLQSCWAS